MNRWMWQIITTCIYTSAVLVTFILTLSGVSEYCMGYICDGLEKDPNFIIPITLFTLLSSGGVAYFIMVFVMLAKYKYRTTERVTVPLDGGYYLNINTMAMFSLFVLIETLLSIASIILSAAFYRYGSKDIDTVNVMFITLFLLSLNNIGWIWTSLKIFTIYRYDSISNDINDTDNVN